MMPESLLILAAGLFVASAMYSLTAAVLRLVNVLLEDRLERVKERRRAATDAANRAGACLKVSEVA